MDGCSEERFRKTIDALGDEIDKNKLLAMSDSSLLDIAGRKGFGSYLVDI
jgi:hypothetical protein